LGVTVHIQDMRQLYKGKGIKFDSLNLIKPTKENTIFQGFADEESISFDDTSRRVSFEGRDFTSLLIDTPFAGKALAVTSPLDKLVEDLVTNVPTTKNLKIINRTGEPLPSLSKVVPDYNPLAAQRSSRKNESIWDVVQDLVGKAGLIAYIELDSLIITKPRVLYKDTKSRQFIYGKTLKSLNFKRKLGRQKGFNIAVRALNIEDSELLLAKIPEEATPEFAQSIGIKAEPVTITKLGSDNKAITEIAPFLTFRVADVKSKDRLIEIGQGIFEEIGRQQIEGSLSTKDMCVNEDVVEFDLTKIRTGTPVRVEFDIQDMEAMKRLTSAGAKEAYLLRQCYPPQVARAMSLSLGKFDTRFYTKSVQFMMTEADGFSLELEFINFIELTAKNLGF